MSNAIASPPLAQMDRGRRVFLFWACFVALIATAVAFVSRAFIIGDLQGEFFLTETQKGEILGAGLWPFGFSIVLFSLIIDRIGYGKSMIFAFVCHVGCVVMYFVADGYWALWTASALAGLGAGIFEAVVNPVVATLYPKHKTKMLTILHGGWAGGVALGGVLTLCMANSPWQMKAGVLLLPTLLYGVMMILCKFPINERVAAGVPYKDMLKECGVLGMAIVSFMIVSEICRLLKLDAFSLGALQVKWVYVITGAVVLLFGLYTRALGRLMYSFLLLIMILLAITELGTDGWMKELRDPKMAELGIDGGWILVYTSSIMLILRFCIAPFVKVLKPLGVLLMGSLFAAAGLYTLAAAELPIWILVTATVYGIGQAFFWPVTIGLVAERFPRGGALTLNAIAGVGMLGVGIVGFPLMGNLQDTRAVEDFEKTPYAETYVSKDQKNSILGKYHAVDVKQVTRINSMVDLYDLRQKALAGLGDTAGPGQLAAALADNADYVGKVNWTYDMVLRDKDDKTQSYADMLTGLAKAGMIVDSAQFEATVKDEQAAVTGIRKSSAQYAMQAIAILPLIMAACYLGLIIYFRATGGYRAVDLSVDGEVVGEHPVTLEEALSDETAGPSE